MSKKMKTFVSASAVMAVTLFSVVSVSAGVSPSLSFTANIGFSNIQDAFSSAVQWGIFFAILVAGLYLIYAGFRYVSAGDDPKQAEAARTMITNAVIGVIITASVWLLLKVLTMVIPGLTTILQI